MRFDLDEIDEIEIENHLAKSIRYLHDTSLTRDVFYTLDHEIGSDKFIIRRVNWNKFIRRQKDTMTTKQLNFQNRSYYFYNDLINLRNFYEPNLKVNKKSWKDLDIYYLGYIDKKPEWHVNSVNQLYFIINRV